MDAAGLVYKKNLGVFTHCSFLQDESSPQCVGIFLLKLVRKLILH